MNPKPQSDRRRNCRISMRQKHQSQMSANTRRDSGPSGAGDTDTSPLRPLQTARAPTSNHSTGSEAACFTSCAEASGTFLEKDPICASPRVYTVHRARLPEREPQPGARTGAPRQQGGLSCPSLRPRAPVSEDSTSTATGPRHGRVVDTAGTALRPRAWAQGRARGHGLLLS